MPAGESTTRKALRSLQNSRARQVERLRTALRSSTTGDRREEVGITRAIFEAGFGSSSRAYASVTGKLGMTPSALRAGGAGQAIRYTMAATRLGTVLIAQTGRGVCAIEFGDDPAAAKRQLVERFPRACISADDARAGDASLEAVVRYIDETNDDRSLNLPLDIVGTAFQRRVWEALTEIPLGETSTYAELAENVGHPRAVRAVAAACAANPAAIAVPCHRAIRSDGGLGGYRWGLARKRNLLEREGAVASAITGKRARARSGKIES